MVRACKPVCITLLAAALLSAQTECRMQWSPGEPPPGIAGHVTALALTPSGDVIAAGDFSHAGGVEANNIARWDGTAWHSIGPGLPSPVYHLAVQGTGDVLAITPPGDVFRWNGTVWEFTTSVPGSSPDDIAVLPNGDLVVAGWKNVRRWDGGTWHAVGEVAFGDGAGSIREIDISPNGDVIVSGIFDHVDGLPAANIARWDGTIWHALGQGLETSNYNVAVLTNGDVVAARDVFGVLLRWDGSSWTTSQYPPGFCVAMTATQDGGLLLTTEFGNSFPVHRWDGAAWHQLGEPIHAVGPRTLLSLPGGGAAVGGDFQQVGGTPAQSIAMWNGSEWSGTGGGSAGGRVNVVLNLPGGAVLLGGDFRNAWGVGANGVVVFSTPDGLGRSALGAGVIGSVRCAGQMPSGDIVVGGEFSLGQGQPTIPAARWDGSAWHPMGANVQGAAEALLVRGDGSLVLGGDFVLSVPGGSTYRGVVRWSELDGAWESIGSNPHMMVDQVWSLAELTDGGLVAGGMSQSATEVFVSRYDGTAWTPMVQPGQPMDKLAVTSLLTLSDGSLLAGTWEGIYRWQGPAWQRVDSPAPFAVVRSLAQTPGGDVYVIGERSDSFGPWTSRGGLWQLVGPNWVHWTTSEQVLRAFTLPDDSVAVVGGFPTWDNQPHAYYARGHRTGDCLPLTCDTVDFNGDRHVSDMLDIADFLTVFAGGVCSGQLPTDPPCNTDIDFNNDGLFPDTQDIDSLLGAFSGGPCV